MPVLFKMYDGFECNLRFVGSYKVSYTKKYHMHISCNFAYKVVCVDDRFTKRKSIVVLLFIEVKI